MLIQHFIKIISISNIFQSNMILIDNKLFVSEKVKLHNFKYKAKTKN